MQTTQNIETARRKKVSAKDAAPEVLFDPALFHVRVPQTIFVKLTLDIVEQWLETKVDVSRHSSNHINHLAAAITEDDWQVTHQGLAFDWNGKLLDGYSKLKAMLQAGKGVMTAITFGLDPECFKAIDIGRVRKASFLLRKDGVARHASHLSTAIGLHLRYSTALTEQQMPARSRFSTRDVFNYHEDHPEITQIVETVMDAKGKWRDFMPTGVGLTLAIMACGKGHPIELVVEFLNNFGSGVFTSARNPIKVLRDNLTEGLIRPNNGKKEAVEEIMAKTIRAYVKWVKKGGMSQVMGIGTIPKNRRQANDEAEELASFPDIVKYVARHHRVPELQVN